MKLAILILCHKNPKQINMFCEKLENEDITFFIHIDKKASFKNEIISNSRVFVLPDSMRIDVRWAHISQIDATLNLIKYAKQVANFDFFWLCSGQDYPIKSSQFILEYLGTRLDKNFINLITSKNNGDIYNRYDKRNDVFFPEVLQSRKFLARLIKRLYIEISGGNNRTFRFFKRTNVLRCDFYFGSQWWCLNYNTINWICSYLIDNEEYYEFFCNCLCPDESFFQTLIMNSAYADSREDYLHYIDWSKGKNNPEILRVNDYERIINSDYLMARKFDVEIDSKIINLLQNYNV